MKVWLEDADGTAFGMGGAALLREVERTGSLAGAARELGMSYRAAWGRLKKTEAGLGVALVEKKGGNKAGYRLSVFGRELLEAFEAWDARVRAEAERGARELLPLDFD
nr:LysR family transcriptional regulator [Desulfobaculum xiamenense]